MKSVISLIALSLFLLGCAQVAEDRAPSVHRYDTGYASSLNTGARQPHAGQWAVAAIGTPFYLVFKTAVCGASLVVAAPAAAVLTIADSPYGMTVNQLGDGVADNCGPPYVLSPS